MKILIFLFIFVISCTTKGGENENLQDSSQETIDLNIDSGEIMRSGRFSLPTTFIKNAPIKSLSFRSIPLSNGSNGLDSLNKLNSINVGFFRTGQGSVLTSKSSIVEQVGNTYPRFGDRGNGPGLALDGIRTNLWTNYDAASGWNAHAGVIKTANVPGIKSPNGITGTVDEIDFGTCAIGNGIFRGMGCGSGLSYVRGVWVRSKSGISKFLFTDPSGNLQQSQYIVVDTNWKWISFAGKSSQLTIGQALYKTGPESTPIYVYGSSIFQSPYNIDTVPTPVAATVTHQAERLVYNNPVEIIKNGRIVIDVTIMPSGREYEYTDKIYLIHDDIDNYFEILNGKINIKINGTLISLPVNGYWPRFKESHFLIAAGGGLQTLGFIKTSNDNVQNLGEGIPLGNIPISSTIDLLCNGFTNQFAGLISQIDFYSPNELPDWVNSPEIVYEYKQRDINHIIGTGQSNGLGANPALSTTQPYSNIKFNGGLQPGGSGLGINSSILGVVSENALIEGTGTPGGETRYSAFANQLSYMISGHKSLMSAMAVGGAAYNTISQHSYTVPGTLYYGDGLAQVYSGKSIADSLSQTYWNPAILHTHGEGDDLLGTSSDLYSFYTKVFQRDITEDFQNITGQIEPVVMFASQDAAWTSYANRATALSAIGLYKASEEFPHLIYVTNPKYMEVTSDGTHITNLMQQLEGEYMAVGYYNVFYLGNRNWTALKPKNAIISGDEITITFKGNIGPLQWDSVITDPGNNGFGYFDDSVTVPSIISTTIISDNQVKIKLSAVPTGSLSSIRVRYAFTGIAGAWAGPTTGARGRLRDSSTLVSRTGKNLYNYCLVFDIGVSI